MPTLDDKKRLAVLACLVDGNSVRGTCRQTDVNLRTVLRFGVQLGEGAWNLHDRMARDVATPLIEQDEIWSYCKLKDARATDEQRAAGLGERYTFVGLAMPSRYVITWKVGRRDQETADAFIADMRARLVTMPAMTSDGFVPYVSAIGREFGPGVDYGQTVKNYRKSGRKDDDHRYEPPREPFITKKVVFGAPDMDRATTAHIERNNGTMRHFIGRMRRLVYAFSKKPENHAAAVSLAYCYYNLCWILRTTRVTPAMAAGVTDHVWDLAELMDEVLSAKPCERAIVKPLVPRKPEGPARELPAGRGFLRLVQGGNDPQPHQPQGPAPAPVVAAAAPHGAPAVAAPTPAPCGQLDLLSWRPRPAAEPSPVPASRADPAPRPASKRLDMTPDQLSLLFGIDLDPEPPRGPRGE